MALGVYETVRYTRRLKDGKSERVEGLRVGRFAIRETEIGDHTIFVVEHTPSGYRVFIAHSLEDAAMLADDLSRFSEKDPSAKDPKRAAAQMGPKIEQWVRIQQPRLDHGDAPLSYRDFNFVEHEAFTVTGRRFR